MKPTHTPGPWEARQFTKHDFAIARVGYMPFGQVGRIHEKDTTVAANARLVAAAPELISACDGAQLTIGSVGAGINNWMTIIRNHLSNHPDCEFRKGLEDLVYNFELSLESLGKRRDELKAAIAKATGEGA